MNTRARPGSRRSRDPGRDLAILSRSRSRPGFRFLPGFLQSKINFYLKNPDLSNRVSISGYNRVLKEHLWEHRFKALFTHLESNFL